MWLKRLLVESLGYKQGCVPVYEDNKACISWANDDETVSKSARHIIHVSYHYILRRWCRRRLKKLKSNMWTQSIIIIKWQMMCSQRHY
mmetsp:Transcript_10244/g.18156  ORF Transcript_10244/g.18156 Transcript_10244/m.18156 type:complete len:88 (-) Transcript_10244:167-430(-)